MIFIENYYFIYGNWAGMVADLSRMYFRTFLVSKPTSKTPCWVPKPNFLFSNPIFENVIVYFSSKFQFWSHKPLNPSCTKCSYGPYGPFWFSVNKCNYMEKRYQKTGFREKPTFWDFCKKGGTHRRLRVSLASGVSPAQKFTFLFFLDRPCFEKMVFSKFDIFSKNGSPGQTTLPI